MRIILKCYRFNHYVTTTPLSRAQQVLRSDVVHSTFTTWKRGSERSIWVIPGPVQSFFLLKVAFSSGCHRHFINKVELKWGKHQWTETSRSHQSYISGGPQRPAWTMCESRKGFQDLQLREDQEGTSQLPNYQRWATLDTSKKKPVSSSEIWFFGMKEKRRNKMIWISTKQGGGCFHSCI